METAIDYKISEESRQVFSDITLLQAQKEVDAILASGKIGSCPCCGQKVKKYARRLYSELLRCLMRIAQHPSGYNVPKGATKADYCKLFYWGLSFKDKETKLYHITELGRLFLANQVKVPKYVIIYNGQLLGTSEEVVDIDECRKDFDLDELMNPKTLQEAQGK